MVIRYISQLTRLQVFEGSRLVIHKRRPQWENMSLADSNVSQPPITCKAVEYFGNSLLDGRDVSYPVPLVWCVVEFSASDTPILIETAEVRLPGKVVQ